MGLFDGTPLERPVASDDEEPVGDRSKSAGGPLPSEQSPRVRRERRRGKWSTIVAGVEGGPAQQKALLKELRTRLGAGGGITDGELILQGDHRDAVVERLVALGYRAKPAGG